MKYSTAIASNSGERIVTSTTETLQIKASELQPCDWLMVQHRRSLRKDKRIKEVNRSGRTVVVHCVLGSTVLYNADQLVDVERTK